MGSSEQNTPIHTRVYLGFLLGLRQGMLGVLLGEPARPTYMKELQAAFLIHPPISFTDGIYKHSSLLK